MMQALLNDPIMQVVLSPLMVALLVSGALLRTRLAWIGVVAALATQVALSTGISFTPLSASRKILLLVLLAPFIGLTLDLLPRSPRSMIAVLPLLCGMVTIWVFWSLIAQKVMFSTLAITAALVVFVVLMVSLTMTLRHDGTAAGAATVALGLAVGVNAMLSASIGNFANGISLTVGGAALLLWQFTTQRNEPPGYLGTLSVGLAAALFTCATYMLAQLPWYAMPLLLLIPLAARLGGAAQGSSRQRMVALTVICVLASSASMLAAWFATRSPGT